MEFVDRENELRELRELKEFSRKKFFVAVLYGLRRVGKTRLLLEFLKDGGIYFFVNKNKTSLDLLNEFQEILRKNKVLGELESVDSWDKFFEVVAARGAPPLVFDEFQNFASVEPSVFGTLQKTVDLNEGKPGLIILSGSLVGLMKNLFKNSKEPLYGRIKKGVKLEPLDLDSCLKLGEELGLSKEDSVKVYCVFGGYPKYYVALEDFQLQKKSAEEIIDALLLAKNAPLEDEVNVILSQEFGKRSGVYYSILEAIANGSNTSSSVAGYLNTAPTSLTRQIKELKDYFELIEFEKPFRGKKGAYKIKHPLLDYWFSQVYRNYSEYAARKPEFVNALKKNLNTVFGKCFERVAREFLVKKLGLVNARRQWGKTLGARDAEEGKTGRSVGVYEIDLIGESEKETFVFEFKWSELKHGEAASVLKKLQSKASCVPGLPANSKFGLVAKKIEDKQKLQATGYLAFDLNDF